MADQSTFATALFDPGQPCPPELQAWNGSDPHRRFAVYRNNIVVSLIDALAATFPVCCQLVGDAFFRAMARAFVMASPPRARILTFYGREFPAFIDAFGPAASVPYLTDMARLEMLRLEATHCEDMEPVGNGEIAGVLSNPDRLPGLRVDLHPSVAVHRSQYAIVTLWAAHQDEEANLAGIDPLQPQTLLVVRTALDVQIMSVTTATGVFIDQLKDGASLLQAEQQARAHEPGFDLTAALTLLLQYKMMTTLYPGD